MTISACKAQGKYVGICGQGPSVHPDLARWLLDEGIEKIRELIARLDQVRLGDHSRVFNTARFEAFELENQLQSLAMRAFDAIGATGWGRVDILVDEQHVVGEGVEPGHGEFEDPFPDLAHDARFRRIKGVIQVKE